MLAGALLCGARAVSSGPVRACVRCLRARGRPEAPDAPAPR